MVWDVVEDAVLVVTPGDGIVRYWNRAAEVMYGCAAADIIGRPIEPVVHTELPDGSGVEGIREAVRRDGAWRGVVVQRLRDGRELRIEAAVSGIRGPDGTLTELVTINRDVTAKWQAERALRLSEANLQALFDSAREAHYLLDPELRILAVNRVTVEANRASWKREVRVGDSCIDYVDPENRASFVHHCQQSLAGRTIRYEREVKLPSGESRWYELNYAPVRASDGTILGVSFCGLDVTERRRRSEELWLRDRAIAASTASVVVADARRPDMPLVYVNPAFTTMTGYTSDEVLGRNCRFLQGPDTDPADRERLRDAIRARRSCHLRIKNYRKDGSPFWNNLTVSPVHDSDGELTHYVGIQTDDTERVTLEERLRRSARLESVGRLAGGVAHDFNNLLSIILLCCDDLLGAGHIGVAERSSLLEIQSAGLRATDLTRQLLAYARRQRLAPRVIDLGQTVEALGTMLRRLIPEDVDLRIVRPPGPCLVHVDPGQVEQVVVNLALNARDAMPDGGVMTIETRGVSLDEDAARRLTLAPGKYVRLVVRDSGVGMGPDTAAHVFEPFYTTKGPGRGTGLGLATVHGIVEQSGGRIRFDSEPGNGTTFEVFLRAVEGAVRPTEVQETSSEARRELVLIVEDEPAVLTLIGSLLKRSNYRVLQAANAQIAIALCENCPEAPELLLSDVVLPGMNGIELSRKLRDMIPNLRVLFMSGYPAVPEAEQSAFDDTSFLAKPIRPKTLLHRVREVLDAP